MRGERAKGSEIWRRLLDQGKERARTGWENWMENMYQGGLEIIWGQGGRKNIVPGNLAEHERIRWL